MRSFVSCRFYKANNENDQVNKEEIGTACRMHETKKGAHEILKKGFRLLNIEVVVMVLEK
jgi:hypothetical protein